MDEIVIAECSSASPDMDSFEFEALKDSIATLGQMMPVVMCRGQVIDGRKRVAACRALGIAPVVVSMAEDREPTKMAEALNLMRTHYTPSQRAMFAARMATLRRGEVGNGRSPNEETYTIAGAAASVGVATSHVHSAKSLRREAAPEVVEAVERGHLTLHAARQIAKALPREEQAAKVQELQAEPPAKRKQVAAKLGASTFRRLPKKAAGELLERCVAMIEAAAHTISTTEPTKLRADEAQDWADRLNEALPVIRTFLKEIEAVYGKRRA